MLRSEWSPLWTTHKKRVLSGFSRIHAEKTNQFNDYWILKVKQRLSQVHTNNFPDEKRTRIPFLLGFIQKKKYLCRYRY
jgi:hypothetical protein